MPRTLRIAAFVLLGILVAGSATASSFGLLRCSGDGRVRRSCCCPSDVHPGEVPVSRVSRSSCCESSRVDVARSTWGRGDDAARFVPPALAVSVAETPAPVKTTAPARAVEVRARPGPPRIFLQNSALLI